MVSLLYESTNEAPYSLHYWHLFYLPDLDRWRTIPHAPEGAGGLAG